MKKDTGLVVSQTRSVSIEAIDLMGIQSKESQNFCTTCYRRSNLRSMKTRDGSRGTWLRMRNKVMV